MGTFGFSPTHPDKENPLFQDMNISYICVESVVKVYIMMTVSGVYRGCCGQHKVTSLFWNSFLITHEINYWSLPSNWHSLIVGVLKIFNNRTFLFFIYMVLDVGSCMRKVLVCFNTEFRNLVVSVGTVRQELV